MAIINESRDSPCQPSKYNEDEPYNSPLFDDNDSAIISSSSSSSNCDESDRYFESLEDEDDETDRSLLPEFKKYIEEKVASKVDMDFNNHDNDNNEITRGNINPSLISQEADELLNGEMQLSESMKMPVDVDDNSEFPNDENILDPMTPKSQRKRRSLTEKSTNNPLTPSNKSINPKNHCSINFRIWSEGGSLGAYQDSVGRFVNSGRSIHTLNHKSASTPCETLKKILCTKTSRFRCELHSGTCNQSPEVAQLQ
ncbi:unnamed protein product [Lepeophtheirus salmonis]|uniref:(salmon louse) hypothetical protein n=1 Tax=Lepeophtheirus salmonis TaxID=72036 RepID=A0A7R8GZ20_LEPSM|nr:unnamed protein product [Lepeophtheirus salmonis]CAF2756665.1 unnamed protein product [Lepeophtheirus salmonis]